MRPGLHLAQSNIISLGVLAFKEWAALPGGKTEPRP